MRPAVASRGAGGPAGRLHAGFTLVELLVVLAILGLLVGIAMPPLFKYFARAKEDAARIQIQTIASGLELFMLKAGRYPAEQEGLRALVEPPANLEGWTGPYVSDPGILVDPWGHPYVYHYPGRRPGSYDLYTLGPDGTATGPPDAAPAGAGATR